MAVALPGTGVSKGVGIGKARILQRGRLEILEYVLPRQHVEEEVVRFQKALATARSQLEAIRDRIPSDTPEEIAAFIDTHLLMLEDSTLSAAPVELIRSRRCNAEWALKLQQNALEKVFDAMDDAYLKTRRDDVAHVAGRVQQVLSQGERSAGVPEPDAGSRIVIAIDIAPSDLLLLHEQQVAAIVTERGGPLSHTAILARNLGIPAIMGVTRAYQYIDDDEPVVVDGERGVLMAGLDPATLDSYRRYERARRRARASLNKLKDQPATTRDGVEIVLHVNIDLPGDLGQVRRVGASGVGLFRTEFLYMNRRVLPDEEEQYRIYRRALKRLRGLPLTLRTLDLGADKGTEAEITTSVSPLGLRAVRFCLKEVDLFRAQLRAALRASAHGPVRLLIPMLTHIGEVHQVRGLLVRYMEELSHEGKPFDSNIPMGGMIEVPAAALCAESLAGHLDFLSVGTNDLIQYTLATDRIDAAVSHLYDPLNPAVLRLLAMILDAGRRRGVPVAMCGEMAGDPLFTRLLLGMGLSEFSMPAGALLEVKSIITSSDVAKIRHRVHRLLKQHDPLEIADALEAINRL
ncbi:phosphoenolpyruvate--protein phosphotransferase [Thiohalomonas denitrificans]|uniref:phosphoenolpyruvate--protein phosphotransferase n=1 Tax=Thiohalomonas denitrificans TaxID=415747 RepID=UPI0026E9236D|nr:phosphoenolpyruvate--protein phosphotransferase [Thiohalomonas denitrificans]